MRKLGNKKDQSEEFKNLSDRFEKAFNMQLSKYIRPILGFDIVKLDCDIETPKDMTMNEFISLKYGEDGCQVVLDLLDFEACGGFLGFSWK